LWRCAISFRGNVDTQVRGFYFAASGNDSFSGKTIEVPKLTIQAAIDAASALTPSESNVALVTSAQGGSFTESFVLEDFIQFNGQDTTITADSAVAVTLATSLRCRLTSVSNSQASGITMRISSKNLIDLSCQQLTTTGDGGTVLSITGTVDNIFIDNKLMIVGGDSAVGVSVESTTAAPIDINIDSVQLSADNTVFIDQNPITATDITNVSVSTVDSGSSTGTTAFLVQNGELIVPTAGQITAETVINVMSGAKLVINATSLTGNIIVANGGVLECYAGTVTGDITVESGGIMRAYIHNNTGTISNDGTISGFIGDVTYSEQIALSFRNEAERDSFFSSNLSLLQTDLVVNVKTGSTITAFVWTGDDNPATYDGDLWMESSINVGSGTLFLGIDGMSLSSAARTVNLVDAYGSTSIPIGTQFDAAGNLPPFQYDFGVSSLQSVADVFDTILSDPQTMLFSTVSNTMTSGYAIRPGTVGTLRVQAFAGTLETDPRVLDDLFTIVVGDLGTVKEIVLTNKTLVETGDDILLKFSGIQLNGGLQTSGVFNGQTVPYLDADFALLTRRDLVIQGDAQDILVFADGSTQDHGATRSADDWHVAASIFKQSFSTATQDESPEGVFFRDDGLKMYVAGDEFALIYEYDLSTSWDVSTAIFLQSFDPSITDPLGVFFRPTGLTMFVLGAVGDTVEEFVLTSAWDITTASTVQSIDLSSLGGGGLAHNLYFKSDGFNFYVIDQTTKEVEQYAMTTAWDIGTASLTTVFDTSLSTTFGLSFKLDGTMLYVAEGDGTIVEYNLTTPWLVDTAELVNTFAASGPSLRGMFFKNDGSKFYIAEDSSSTIIEYNVGLDISAPFNLRAPIDGGSVSIHFIDENNLTRSQIEYQDSLQRLLIDTDESSIILSASGIDINSQSDLDLLGAGDINLNVNIAVDQDGQTITLTSEDASGTPSVQFNDSSDADAGSLAFDETDDDVTLTANLGDLQLFSTSSDIEIIAGSGFVGVNTSDPASALHVYQNNSNTGLISGITVEQDGTGDSVQHFVLTGNQDWTIGIDNSESNQFAIRPNLVLNNTAPLQILTTGEVGINKTPRANHCLDIDTSLNTIVDLYDQKGVTLEQQNGPNGNSTDFFFNRGDVGSNQSEFLVLNSNDNTDTQRYFGLNYTDAGTTGGLSIRYSGFVAVGIGNDDAADTLLHLRSEDAATVAIQTWEGTGADGSITRLFVGNVDPIAGSVVGDPGDRFIRTRSGVSSGEFIHKGASSDSTSWEETATGTFGNVTTSDVLTSNVLLKGNGGVDVEAINGSGLAQIRTNNAGDALQIITDDSGTASFELLDDNQNDRVVLEYDIDANTGNLTTSVQFTIDVTGDLNLSSSDQVTISADVLSFDSPNDDTDSIFTLETEGANAGITHTFVGDRDPNENVTGAGSDEYRRGDGALSGSYESREATTGTNWFKRSVFPSDIIQINTADEFEALASGGVITVDSNLTIVLNVQIVTTTVFDIIGPSSLTLMSLNASLYVYLGTGTVFTISGAAGGALIIRDMDLITFSTGTWFDITGGLALDLSTTIVDLINMSTVGGTLGTFQRGSGIPNGPVLFANQATFTNRLGGFVLSDTICTMANIIFTQFDGVNSGAPFVEVKTTIVQAAPYLFHDIVANLDVGETFIRVDPGLNDGSAVTIRGAQIERITGVETLFNTSGVAGTFTAVADASIASVTIDSVSNVTDDIARFNFTVGPTLFVNQEIVITDFVTNTIYNQTALITATGAGFFEVDYIAFGTNEASVGSFRSDSVTMTDTGTSLVDGDTIKLDTDDSTDYFGGAVVYNQLTNTFQVNKAFTVTQTGTWSQAGLDQTNALVLATDNPQFVESKYIATAFVNDNSTANGAIVNNTFTDMVFGTAGTALAASSTIERWKLIDELNGKFEYTGREPFDGYITFDFTVISSGGSVSFRFKWVRDSNAVVSNSFIDFADSNPDEIFSQLNDFITAGFNPDDQISVSGSTSNDGTYTIAEVFAGRLVLIGSDALVNESAGSAVTITALETDLADNVEALINIGSSEKSITKTFPLRANTGDQIRPQITRNSGTSAITTTYASIYATQ